MVLLSLLSGVAGLQRFREGYRSRRKQATHDKRFRNTVMYRLARHRGARRPTRSWESRGSWGILIFRTVRADPTFPSFSPASSALKLPRRPESSLEIPDPCPNLDDAEAQVRERPSPP